MKFFTLTILIIISFSSFSAQHTVINLPYSTSQSVVAPGTEPFSIDRLLKIKIKNVESALGKKLTLKEKIAFKIAQFKLKKELKPAERSKGQTALTLSIIALCSLIVPAGFLVSIPLAIIAMAMGTKARRENKNDRKAKTAIILSTITLALIVAVILLVAILLSSGGFAAL